MIIKKIVSSVMAAVLTVMLFSGMAVFAADPVSDGSAPAIEYALNTGNATLHGKYTQEMGGYSFTYGSAGFSVNFTGTDFWMYVPETPMDGGKVRNVGVSVLVDSDMAMDAEMVNINRSGWFKLASGLENGDHHIEVRKMSRGFYGIMASDWFVASKFGVNKGGKVNTPDPLSDLVIEVYGDSISNGDAVWLDKEGIFGTAGANHAYTSGNYTGVIGRLLDAEMRVCANTGNGLCGWVMAQGGNGEVENLLPPQKCWNVVDSQHNNSPYSHEGANAADVVIINLGTNDRIELGGGDLTDTAFENEYIRFIKQIKTDCPDAIVICTVGAMGLLKGNNYDVDFDRITSEVNTWANEEFAFFTELAHCSTIRGGLGYDNGHPSNAAHEVYGLQIARIINEKLNLGVDLSDKAESEVNINLGQIYSSSADCNSEHSKEKAFDSDYASSWQAPQNQANGAFLQVDYDKVYRVKKVAVDFEEFYPTGTTKVEYSIDGQNWLIFDSFTATEVSEYILTLSTPVSARHLRITFSGTSDSKGYPAKIREFEAYAVEDKEIVAAITKQPQDVYGGIGETVRVEFAAEGDGLTYEWYFKNAKGTNFYKSSITANCYEIEMNADRAGRQVYCVITDKYGNSVKTDTVTIDLPASTIVITKQPQDAYAAVGAIATTTVTATGEGLTYQWYVKNPTGSKFNKSSITAETYSFTMSSAFNGRQVYCVITDKNGNSVQTEIATLSVPASTVVITGQPQDAYAAVGAIATTTVTATGEELTYQWYVKNPTGSKFNKSSITVATYYFTMSSAFSGRQVYCVITDKYGNSVTTDTVTVRMSVSIKVQPADAAVKNGETATTTVTAIGDGLTYQWYLKNPNGTKFNKSSITDATYYCTMSSAFNGRQVYCVITDKYGNSVQTETVTLSVPVNTIVITEQPANASAKSGAKVTTAVVAEGEGLTYQWYLKNPHGTKFNKSSITAATYSCTMSSGYNGRQVYCVITDKYGNTVQTETVTLSMN